jgi:hypothetical protein
MIPTFYRIHLEKKLTLAQFKLIEILLPVIQSEKQIRLERLSRVFPSLITSESRRRKLQRFLDLPNLTISLIWFPFKSSESESVAELLSFATTTKQKKPGFFDKPGF